MSAMKHRARPPRPTAALYSVETCPCRCVFTVIGEKREALRAVSRHIVLKHADDALPYTVTPAPFLNALRAPRRKR